MSDEQIQLAKLPCAVSEFWVQDALSHLDGAPVERLYAVCEDGTMWMCERYKLRRGGYGEYWNWDRYIPPMPEDASLSEALLLLIPPLIDLDKSLREMNEQSIRSIASLMAVPEYVWKGYSSRREMVEAKLGYKLPDWVWWAEEKMRRTEGSGNGRIIRD